jgi:phage terminase small subunit
MVGDEGKKKLGRPSKVVGKPMLSIVANTDAKVIRLSAGQGKDANGLTAKQELFCQEVAKGNNLSAAYRIAYNAENMKPNIINNEACKLMARQDIAARVNRLIEERQAKSSHDSIRIKQHVIERLWIESQDTKNPATTRVRALELLGKMTTVSLFTDRVMTETVEARSPEDIEQQIRDKLAKMTG